PRRAGPDGPAVSKRAVSPLARRPRARRRSAGLLLRRDGASADAPAGRAAAAAPGHRLRGGPRGHLGGAGARLCVVARQQVQTLNEELAAINEELRASNEEYQLANVALSEAQRQLRHLNEELEARVQQRTQALQAQQTAQQRLFAQAPMAIVVLRGPRFIIEQANANAEIIW
nr:hypothetical protein [Tanacetum cinerariifolium]